MREHIELTWTSSTSILHRLWSSRSSYCRPPWQWRPRGLGRCHRPWCQSLHLRHHPILCQTRTHHHEQGMAGGFQRTSYRKCCAEQKTNHQTAILFYRIIWWPNSFLFPTGTKSRSYYWYLLGGLQGQGYGPVCSQGQLKTLSIIILGTFSFVF